MNWRKIRTAQTVSPRNGSQEPPPPSEAAGWDSEIKTKSFRKTEQGLDSDEFAKDLDVDRSEHSKPGGSKKSKGSLKIKLNEQVLNKAIEVLKSKGILEPSYREIRAEIGFGSFSTISRLLLNSGMSPSRIAPISEFSQKGPSLRTEAYRALKRSLEIEMGRTAQLKKELEVQKTQIRALSETTLLAGGDWIRRLSELLDLTRSVDRQLGPELDALKTEVEKKDREIKKLKEEVILLEARLEFFRNKSKT